jgi:uncharacterized protein YggU (UPF0235/DUF167 family)
MRFFSEMAKQANESLIDMLENLFFPQRRMVMARGEDKSSKRALLEQLIEQIE